MRTPKRTKLLPPSSPAPSVDRPRRSPVQGQESGAVPNPPLRDYWPHVAAQLRFTTQDTGNVENYEVCWREIEALHDPLFGNLGDLPLRRWTRATAIRALAALATKSDGGPCSLSTLSCKVNAMAAVFRRASLDRHPFTDEPLYPNPNPFRNKMALLKEVFGNRELVARGRAEDVRPYTRDELNRVLAVTRERSRSDYLLLLLCARCGLRRSEAIALCWRDFQQPARSVSIRRKASKPRNVAVRVSSQLKTENSRRTVPVPSDAWQEVSLWREHCVRQASLGASPYSRYTQPSRRGPPRDPSEFLFPPRRPGNTEAPVLDPDAWAHRLKTDLERAAIDLSGRRHFAHNLRHTYASELLARSADLSLVAKLLGDTLAVAEGCYAHLVQSKRLRELADSLSEDL
jgi:integrase